MKASVSIPDELWEHARRTLGEDGPSQIVQEALRRAFGSARSGPTFSERFEDSVPDSGQTRVERIRDKLLRQAQETWQRGYDDGLDLAERVSWDALESFGEEANFELSRWIWKVKAPADELSLIRDELAWKNSDGTVYFDEDGDPILRTLPRPYREGFERALTDVWKAVAETNTTKEETDFLPGSANDDIPF